MDPRVPRTFRNLHLSINVFIVLLAAGYFFAAFYPSVENWGFHPLAFGPGPLKWLIPVLMILPALPRVQLLGVRAVRHAGGAYLNLGRWARGLTVAAAAVILGLLFALFSSAGIPGDGQLLTHNLHRIKAPTEVAHLCLHEPLTGLVIWSVALGLAGEITISSAETAYRTVSILCGLAVLPFLASVVRRVVPGRTERMLAFLFVLASGTILLFFGHVENYTIALLGVAAFIHFSLAYCDGETSLVAPAVSAGILIPLYFGMVCIFPALGYLFIVEFRRTRTIRSLLLPAASFVVVCLGLLLLTGFTPERFTAMMAGGGKHLIGVLESTDAMAGYTLFSGRHLIDIANLIVMISPFSLLLIIALSARGGSGGMTGDGAALIFILSISCGLLVLLFRCDLGMPRDWDLLAPFMLGGILLSLQLLVRRVPPGERRRSMLFAVAAVTVVHTVPWIMLDHDPLQAVRQNRLILEQTTWIEGMYKGYEGLAMSAKRRGEYDSAAVYYHRFLAGDSGHPRILGNLADVYRLLGNEDSEMAYTEKAVRHGTVVPALFFNLGVIYAGRGRYEDAIRVMQDGLRLEPGRPDVLNSVGALILRARQDCSAAMPYFTEAIRYDASYALAYLNAGECSAALGDTASMSGYLTTYARLDSAGAARQGVLRRLTAAPQL